MTMFDASETETRYLFTTLLADVDAYGHLAELGTKLLIIPGKSTIRGSNATKFQRYVMMTVIKDMNKGRTNNNLHGS